MGWKTIKGHRYYYRNHREGGRVVSTYYGCGEAASVIAQLEALDREAARIDREQERTRRREALALDAEVAASVASASAEAWSWLESRGFHRHKGQWRRKRVKGDGMGEVAKHSGKSAVPAIGRQGRVLDGWSILRIVERLTGAKAGDAMFDRVVDEVAGHARELAGPDPSPIERTLGETAAFAWAALRYFEVVDISGQCRTLDQAAFDVSRVESAHRRYLSALKVLAQVRRLAIPTVQVVNVGDGNRTNVIGALSGGPGIGMPG